MRRAVRSRSGRSNPGGKCVDRIDVPVPATVKADLAAVAHLMGVSATELARQVIEDWLYGRIHRMRSVSLDGRPVDGRNVG